MDDLILGKCASITPVVGRVIEEQIVCLGDCWLVKVLLVVLYEGHP